MKKPRILVELENGTLCRVVSDTAIYVHIVDHDKLEAIGVEEREGVDDAIWEAAKDCLEPDELQEVVRNVLEEVREAINEYALRAEDAANERG